MVRKRLTASTLMDSSREASGVQVVDLTQRLLGKGASDSEIVAAGRLLYKGLGSRGINALHRLARRITAEAGEPFNPADDDVGENNPVKTQDYVSEHEITPDHSVLDVVLNERTPTHNPTAKNRKEKEEDITSADTSGEKETTLKDPKDLEEDVEDFVKDKEEDEEEDEEEEELVEDEEEEEEEEPEEPEEKVKHKDEAETEEEDEETPGEEEGDLLEEPTLEREEGEDEEEPELEDSDGEFTLDDMEELEQAGVDGVLTSSKRRSSSLPRRKQASAQQKGKKANFKPSRTRVAAPDPERDFDILFGVPDVSRHFS